MCVCVCKKVSRGASEEGRSSCHSSKAQTLPQHILPFFSLSRFIDRLDCTAFSTSLHCLLCTVRAIIEELFSRLCVWKTIMQPLSSTIPRQIIRCHCSADARRSCVCQLKAMPESQLERKSAASLKGASLLLFPTSLTDASPRSSLNHTLNENALQLHLPAL